mmetsp:Transcript_3025/g.6896  ORF Transcript_3025/g.6896 Transcript_3025/m.6896 type:complete len:144 (+) Transcript_3025:295-726(+)
MPTNYGPTNTKVAVVASEGAGTQVDAPCNLEDIKTLKRKESNRLSAKRSRDRKRDELDSLRKEGDVIKAQAAQLADLTMLRLTVETLQGKAKGHTKNLFHTPCGLSSAGVLFSTRGITPSSIASSSALVYASQPHRHRGAPVA